MSRLVVCAPMRVEALALRRALPAGAVTRTGYAWRSRLAAAGGIGDPGVPLAVAGVAGSTRDDVRPGDVVVATEVSDGRDRAGASLAIPSAPLLAAALREQGLRVHAGPVRTLDHVATPDEARQLGTAGVLAVDLESAPLARAAAAGAAGGARPVAVVRAVVDTPSRPLWRPDLPLRGWAALSRLPAVGRVLATWAAAAGDREVLLAAPRSFCAGVERAIGVVERALEEWGPPVYVRKQIVHNAHVVGALRARGAVFVDELDEVPEGARVVFSAHGVAPAVWAQAGRRGLRVVDATCPLVAKVHAEARRRDRDGDHVVLIGHARHEETEGTLGELDGRGLLVQSVADAERLDVPDPDRVSYLMQTTLSVDEAADIVAVLRRRFPRITGPASDDICYATTNRQLALREVAAAADLVLVLGSPNSSNSVRLVELARRQGTLAYLVDDVHQVRLDWLAGARRIGVSAGASAPPELVDELLAVLGGLGGCQVVERVVATENVSFTLPKEVRT